MSTKDQATAKTAVNKAQNIVTRLNAVRQGLLTLNTLLDETMKSLTSAQAELANPQKFIAAEKVGKAAGSEYMAKNDIEAMYVARTELEATRALLEECQKEINDIDGATVGVEEAMNTILNKATPKTDQT